MLSRRKLLGTTLGAATSFYACAGRDPALAQPNRRPKQLVLVHGRNQQGSATEIKAEWVAALRAGARKIGRDLPGDVNIDMAYYGDALDRFAKQLDVPVASDIKARGNPGDNELLVFQAQIAEQLRVKAKITDDQVNAEYGPSDKPRGPLNWEWVQAILRALDKYGPGVSKRTIETFTRDVFLYVTRSTVQDEIDRIVAAHLTDAPMVIVGHSLG